MKKKYIELGSDKFTSWINEKFHCLEGFTYLPFDALSWDETYTLEELKEMYDEMEST